MLVKHYFSQLLAFSSTSLCRSLLQQPFINIEKPVLPLYSPGQNTEPEDDITLARLCADSYNPGEECIAGITRADTQTLARLSLSPGKLRSLSGLQSMIYHHQDTGILAFAGSNDMADMVTNIRQGQGLPSLQYREAVQLARHLLSHSSYPWLFIGHSLGGGLASLCAVVLQQPAVIFNAAGLAENTLIREGLSLKAAQQRGMSLIRHYVLEYDWLTYIQDGLDIPKALGRRIALDYYPPQTAHSVLQKMILAVKAHMLMQVITAMENRREPLL
ncbi:MAG: hypothetical protein RR510_15495 [Morganella sp. (in: enterobacteria)]